MELLTIQHIDFTMSIECGKFDAIWTKAKNNIGEQALHSTYSWTEGVVSVTLNSDDEDSLTSRRNSNESAISRKVLTSTDVPTHGCSA